MYYDTLCSLAIIHLLLLIQDCLSEIKSMYTCSIQMYQNMRGDYVAVAWNVFGDCQIIMWRSPGTDLAATIYLFPHMALINRLSLKLNIEVG